MLDYISFRIWHNIVSSPCGKYNDDDDVVLLNSFFSLLCATKISIKF